VVTFGLYQIVWLIRRRNEIVRVYKLPLPQWWWLFAPSFAALACFGLFIVLALTEQSALAIAIGLIIALPTVFASIALTIWWVWRFGKAAAYVTNGKVTATWTMLFYLFAGLAMVFFLQYYFNGAQSAKELNGAPMSKPSKKFVVWATITIVANISLYAGMNLVSAFYLEDTELTRLGERVDKLTSQYDSCIDRLDRKYVEVTAANEADYNAAHDHCEDIRIRQNNAVDEYNEYLDW
jgi:hypothetical protein